MSLRGTKQPRTIQNGHAKRTCTVRGCFVPRNDMVGLVGLLFFAVVGIAFTLKESKSQQTNHAPVVKFISPQNNSIFDWNTPINYKIGVSDKEDGDTKFDEINAKEVLLEVRYVKDRAKLPAILKAGVRDDPPGLALIRASNCFNCHNFNSKLIGPSFYDITKRYAETPVKADSLESHIIKGSTGIWGTISMPSHPELSRDQAKAIVRWLLTSATNPDVRYYVGLAGNIVIPKPVYWRGRGAFVLTASYTDHGIKEITEKHLKGQDAIVLQSK